MSARRSILNALPNLLWTAVFVGPVYGYCAHYVSARCLYAFGVAGMIPFFLPTTVLQCLQLSEDVSVYRRLRVPLLIQVTQDAPWLRRFGVPDQRVCRDRKGMEIVVRDTWMRERFHLGLFVFSALCAGVAAWRTQWVWFFLLLVVNTLYNLYPVWLQQYLRLRLMRLLRR